MRNAVSAVSLLLLLTCTTARVSSEPASVVDALLAALDHADPAIATLFTDDATVFFPMNDRPLRANGREEIAAAFAALFALPGYQKGRGLPKPEALLVQKLGGDAALVTFQTTNPNVVSRRTLVVRLDGGEWRIAHLHGSNIRLTSN
jgi:ketosteroid isomerase-like protein